MSFSADQPSPQLNHLLSPCSVDPQLLLQHLDCAWAMTCTLPRNTRNAHHQRANAVAMHRHGMWDFYGDAERSTMSFILRENHT